jgi:hypothetical protein
MTEDEIPWAVQQVTASANCGLQCRELEKSCPYSVEELGSPALTRLITHLATELWDQGFSQTEIISAFSAAILDMPQERSKEEAVLKGRKGEQSTAGSSSERYKNGESTSASNKRMDAVIRAFGFRRLRLLNAFDSCEYLWGLCAQSWELPHRRPETACAPHRAIRDAEGPGKGCRGQRHLLDAQRLIKTQLLPDVIRKPSGSEPSHGVSE